MYIEHHFVCGCGHRIPKRRELCAIGISQDCLIKTDIIYELGPEFCGRCIPAHIAPMRRRDQPVDSAGGDGNAGHNSIKNWAHLFEADQSSEGQKRPSARSEIVQKWDRLFETDMSSEGLKKPL